MEKKTLLRDKHVEYIKSLEEEVRLPICDLLLYNIRNINISLQLIIVSNYPLLTLRRSTTVSNTGPQST